MAVWFLLCFIRRQFGSFQDLGVRRWVAFVLWPCSVKSCKAKICCVVTRLGDHGPGLSITPRAVYFDPAVQFMQQRQTPLPTSASRRVGISGGTSDSGWPVSSRIAAQRNAATKALAAGFASLALVSAITTIRAVRRSSNMPAALRPASRWRSPPPRRPTPLGT